MVVGFLGRVSVRVLFVNQGDDVQVFFLDIREASSLAEGFL